MPSVVRSFVGALCVVGSLAPACAAQSITWATNLDGALAEARGKGTIVVIAIQMPGERGSDLMLEGHYKDARIATLSRETVNLLLEAGPGTVPPDDRKVREHYLKVGADAEVPVPHHLFVKPGADGEPGEVLSSFAFAVSIGQLEWAWSDAIRKVKPDFAWTLGDRARAPESLLYGDAEKDAGASTTPPTRDEVREALKSLRSGSRDPMKSFENMRIVLSSTDKEALQYGRTELRSMIGFLRRPTMRMVADVSPPEWHELPEIYVEDNDPQVRAEAARALEQLKEPKSVKVLRKQLAKEDEAEPHGRILRALAACGPNDKTVFRELERVLLKEKDAAIRAQAAAAAGQLEDRDVAHELLLRALADGESNVRIAAAYAIAARRDADLLQTLEDAQKAERDTEVSGWFATAADVLKGGDLRKFKSFVEKVLGDRKPGDGLRQYAKKVEEWATRGRGGDGGDKAGGDKTGGDETGGDGKSGADGKGTAGKGDDGKGAGARGGRRGG